MSWLRRTGALFEWPGSGDRLRAMEGLRGLSAFLVFFVHFDSLFSSRGGVIAPVTAYLSRLGGAGVDIFFVLSGFLIWDISIRRFPGYGTFLLRRLWRIYPVFLPVLAAQVVALTLAGRAPDPSVVAANLLMLPGVVDMAPLVTVAWSLSWEMFYYATAPLVIALFGLRTWSVGRRAAVVLGAAAAYFLSHLLGVRFEVPVIMFAAGIGLREALCSPSWIGRLTPVTEVLAGGAFALMIAMQGVPASPEWAVWRPPLIGASYAGLCLHAFVRDGWVRRVFSFNPVRWFGNMSYSFYLVHGPALHLTAKALPTDTSQPVALVTGFAVATAASAAMFLCIEKPFSTHRRKA